MAEQQLCSSNSSQRSETMKWTPNKVVILGREILACELWKYKAGSIERGQCLDELADRLNSLKEYKFNVTQRSIRDKLRALEKEFRKKDREERKASGISPEFLEIDQIMEEYIERSEEADKEFTKAASEKREKVEKEQDEAESMRRKAMERLGETKKRTDDPPKKKKRSSNETIEFLQEKSKNDFSLKKEELELQRKKEETAQSQMQMMIEQQQRMFQGMMQFMNQQQQQTQTVMAFLSNLKNN